MPCQIVVCFLAHYVLLPHGVAPESVLIFLWVGPKALFAFGHAMCYSPVAACENVVIFLWVGIGRAFCQSVVSLFLTFRGSRGSLSQKLSVVLVVSLSNDFVKTSV